MFSINYRDPRPIYEQIKSALRRQMTEGELPPGSRLPSVRELAAELAVNPNTIQRAYRELEADGLLCSVPGKGNFVADDFRADADAIRDLLTELDETVAKLRDAGLCTEDICARIQGGGDAL
ncbi:MAG: GntR family transcriptional regulator [Oscillospiraceae bacterium]|nr:GntR family transcriptional regulator [Oscillospiraceae bacterium]